MDEEREIRPGFLPPRAPDGGPPPRFAPPAAPPTPAPPAPPPGQPAAARTFQPPPYQPPDRPVFVARPAETGPSNPMAITGIAIGAIALLLLVMSLGLGYPLCGLLSLIALLLGANARRRIARTGVGRPGQAKAAMWVGGIGLALAILAAIVWAILSASGFAPSELEEWLREQLEQRERSRPDELGPDRSRI